MTRRILWTVMCGLLALGGQAAAQGLGDGRGIDHVGPLVRLENFEAAGDVWADLGFSLTPALLSPLGAKNRLIWLKDQTYLEILAFTELNEFTAPFLAFLEDHEGAKYYGTDVVDVAQAMDRTKGPGAGRACIQLLVDGTPHEFAPLFLGIEVDIKGAVDIARVMKNLGKRPQAEHRRLVNRGVRDLIDRALSSTFEELGDEAVEEVMEHIAGYEKRLGF